MAKKKRTYRKKKSMINQARGVIYAGAKILPAYRAYDVNGGGIVGLENAVYNQGGYRPDGSWSANIVKEQWAPLGVVFVADTIASKIGVYRRIASLFK